MWSSSGQKGPMSATSSFFHWNLGPFGPYPAFQHWHRFIVGSALLGIQFRQGHGWESRRHDWLEVELSAE